MAVAHTLEAAYAELDPKPLTAGQIETLFVQRPNTRTQQLITELKNAAMGEKFIFIGHRGSGKSTELEYAASRLEDQYYTLSVPVFQVYQSASISHDELMFALFSRIIRIATDDKLINAGIVTNAWDKYLRGAVEKVRKYLFSSNSEALPETHVSGKVNVLLAEIELNVSNSQEVRRKLEGRASDLQRDINATINQIQVATGKRVLLIVEDLDKFDLEPIRRLFVDHAGTLQLPAPTTIYSFPVSMRYTDDFDQISRAFKPYALPNIATHVRDGSPDETGRKALREVIMRRAHESLFAPEALERIVICGGVVRDMILLAQDSINNALSQNAPRVEVAHVEEAFNEVCFKRQSLLTDQDYANLPNYRRADLRNSPEIQRWLKNGSLIEYRNHVGIWCDLSPDTDEVLRRHDKDHPPKSNPARRAAQTRAKARR